MTSARALVVRLLLPLAVCAACAGKSRTLHSGPDGEPAPDDAVAMDPTDVSICFDP